MMRELEKDWLFSSRNYRYVHRVLSNKKELEIDLDGTVYLHLKFDYNENQYQMLKEQLDRHFEITGEFIEENNGEEHYYGGDVTLIRKSQRDNLISIQITSSSKELTEAFVMWDNVKPETTMPFIRRYCLIQ